MPEPLVLVVEHESTCPPALLGEWLAAEGCRLDVWRPASTDGRVPDLARYDGLLVLGGEMGAYDDATHPHLTGVKELLRSAASARTPSLGICLGHQLTAVALGGAVERNSAGQTVGLRPVGWTPAAATDPLVAEVSAAGESRGVHWNSDVVTALPAGAVVLATTPDGRPQVVRHAETSWGIQLHPEVDVEVVRAWAEGDRADHLERGIDSDAALDEIAAAHDELVATWRPLAAAFAALARRSPRG